MSNSREAETSALPPGQTEIPDFPRWGLPEYMRQLPDIPSSPTLELSGDVSIPCEIGLGELAVLARVEQVADFHCAATWSRRGLRWEGYLFRDFFDRFVMPRAQPRPGARFVQFTGIDGYTTSLPLEDALAGDVMLAGPARWGGLVGGSRCADPGCGAGALRIQKRQAPTRGGDPRQSSQLWRSPA